MQLTKEQKSEFTKLYDSFAQEYNRMLAFVSAEMSKELSVREAVKLSEVRAHTVTIKKSLEEMDRNFEEMGWFRRDYRPNANIQKEAAFRQHPMS